MLQDGLIYRYADALEAAGLGFTVSVLALILCPLIAYLLGSINSAIIVSRVLYRDDIRKHGSGNAGMTNMLRTYGKNAALLTLLGDLLKTVLSVLIGGLVFGFLYLRGIALSYMPYLAGLFCVIGHIKPIYYGFKGGKGVLCTATAVLMLCPPVFLFLFVAFALIVWLTKYVSLASIVCAAFFPIALQGYMQSFVSSEQDFNGIVVLFGALYALLVIVCHRKNIVRLWRHEENKISFGGHHHASSSDEEEGDTDNKDKKR